MPRPKTPLPEPLRLVPDPGPQGIVSPNLARSGVLPRLDPQAAAAPAMGLAAVGEGVQKLGVAGMALAEKVKEAESLDGQRKAAEIMERGRNKITVGISENPRDPSKWGQIMNDANAETEVELKNLELNPETRAATDHKWEMNKLNIMGAVTTQSNKTKIALGEDALRNTAKVAGATNDSTLYEQNRRTAAEFGISEDELKIWDLQFKETSEQVVEVAQKETILAAVAADPKKALEMVEGSEFKPSVKAWGVNAAQQGIREQFGAGVNDVANEIAKNPTATPDTLERVADGRLDEAEMEKWNAELLRRRNLKIQFERAQPAAIDAAYARLLDEAESFDRSLEDSKREYARIHREAEGLLPVGLRGEVTGIVEKKWRASGDLPDPPEPLKQSVNEMARSMFDAGTLGKFKEPKITVVDGELVEKIVVNPEKEQAALAKKGALLIYMQKWLNLNPGKTPEDAQEVMRQFIRGAAPVIRFTKPPTKPVDVAPQSEGNGPENDAPLGFDGSPLENSILVPLDYIPANPLPR